MNKRAFRIGPGTTLALGCGIVLAYVQWPRWQEQAGQNREIAGLRAQVAQRGARKAPLARNLDTLWRESSAVKLSAVQLQALQQLRNAEARQTKPFYERAQREGEALGRWMGAHQGGASVGEIQEQTADYRAASAALSQNRLGFWQRGLEILSPEQRASLAKKTEVNP